MAALLTILVVEDDSSVRDVVVQLLTDRGFSVLTARTAYEALNVLRGRSVDLLLADIVMPGMDGVDLVREARKLYPGLKVLFATGYAQLAMTRAAFRHGRVLYKPLREPELVRAVQETLAA